MKIKGARGHPESKTHLKNSKTYECLLDQQAFDRQRYKEGVEKDRRERYGYTEPSIFSGSMQMPKPVGNPGRNLSAVEQEVWATLASNGADFGFEDDTVSERDRLVLEAKQLSSFRIEDPESDGTDVDKRRAWEEMENDDELRAELQEIMSESHILYMHDFLCLVVYLQWMLEVHSMMLWRMSSEI
jgi:hypothetical protein